MWHSQSFCQSFIHLTVSFRGTVRRHGGSAGATDPPLEEKLSISFIGGCSHMYACARIGELGTAGHTQMLTFSSLIFQGCVELAGQSASVRV